MKTIFEDNDICVSETGHDFDFIGLVENKTSDKMIVAFCELDERLEIAPNKWIGLLADASGRFMLEQFKTNNFIIYLED